MLNLCFCQKQVQQEGQLPAMPTLALTPHNQRLDDRRLVWSQCYTGFLMSLLWLPTQGPVPCTMCQGDGLLNCRVSKGNSGESSHKHPLRLGERRTRDYLLRIIFYLSQNERILERVMRPERVNVLSISQIYMWLESLQPISYPPGCLVYCPCCIKI